MPIQRVGGHAVSPQAPDALEHLSLTGDDHPALSGGHVLVAEEAECGCIAD